MKTKQKKRHFIINPLKTAGISFTEARNLGFKVGRQLWSTCHDESNRDRGFHCKKFSNNDLAFLNSSFFLGGYPQIKLADRSTLNSYLRHNSVPASNRTVCARNKLE